MAELPNRKLQNQAFLQELERQRLNKNCLRIIDLRGKVAGECQAYQFGDRVHYLDDRAYLLVKQLMARFDGRYTIGVYEALLKALKQLDESEPASINSNQGPQMLSLDQPLQRAEARIVFSTPVQLRLDDVLYHGHTIDLAVNAIRVSLKRAYSLDVGDVVSVDFADFYQQSGLDLLRNVAYQISKLEHDANYTTVVLIRQPQDDDAIADWLRQWLETHASMRPIDIDNELINLRSQFYQRLWLARLGAPVLWLGPAEMTQPLLALHLMSPARDLLQDGCRQMSQWLQQLPLQQLSKTTADVITVFDDTHSFSAPLQQKAAVNKLINWHLSRPDSQLLLLRTSRVTIPADKLKQAAVAIQTIDAAHAEQFNQLGKQVRTRLSVISLKPVFTNIKATTAVSAAQLRNLQTLKILIDEDLPTPETLVPHIQRDKERFYIHTPVTVKMGERQWQLQTLDVSADGLAIKLPADVPVAIKQRLQVDFTRWQTLTRKVKLEGIPYQVKNKLLWQDSIRLGLQRIKNNCPESLNNFFDWVITRNQESLRRDQDDLIKTAESKLFSQTLLPTLAGLPLFLGLDADGQRQIQLIGNTRDNQASRDAGLCQALEDHQLRLGELLKQAGTSEAGCMQTTLYAYDSGHNNWTLAFEQDFSHHRDKALFIQRGQAAKLFRVFHCTLSVLKGNEADRETDLIEQLQQWRQHNAHRVRAIRQQLAQLIGLVELTDISDLITGFYQR